MRWWLFAAFGLVLVPALPASAQDGSADVDAGAVARQLVERGVERSQQDRWDEALELFERSYQIVPRPSTLFHLAGAYLRLGRGTEAIAAYQRYLAEAPADAPNRDAAEAALRTATESVGTLRLEIEPEDAVVRVDDQRVEGSGRSRRIYLDPGERAIAVSAEGYRTYTMRVTAQPGGEGGREITLQPRDDAATAQSAPEDDRFDDTFGHALLGTGIGLAVVGAATLIAGLVDWDRVESATFGDTWGDLEGAYDRASVLTPLGGTLLAVGAVALATGIGWLLGGNLGVATDGESAMITTWGRF